MKIGLVTPIVSLNPAVHNAWERDATVDDLVVIARAADELGLHHLTASEHVAVPFSEEGRRGVRYWDLLATLSYLAAHTQSIRLATHVLVLPYHHPLEVVKRYSTLDRLSGGRVVLGVGVGTLTEEFDLLDVPMEGRGSYSDDALRAIRAAWGVRVPTYDGPHVSFSGLAVDPVAVQPHVPIWIGGQSWRSLRRAIELGDGWVPFGIGSDQLREILAAGRDHDAARMDELELVLHPKQLLDPVGEPAHTGDVLAQFAALGATTLNVRLRHDGPAACVEQLHALVELVDANT